jgi:hypothetical protein
LSSAIGLVLLFGCQQTDSRVYKFTEFEHEFLLQSKEITLNENYKHARIIFYDSLCILTNTPGNKHQIHLYNRKYEYIISSGLTGKGPGEITNPFPAVLDKKNKAIWMMDMGRRKLLKFPVDSMLSNTDFLPHKFVPITDACPIIVQYFPYKNGLFSFSDFYSENALISFSNQSGKLVDSLQIKKSEILKNLENINNNQFNATFIYEKHPQKDIFALAYQYSDKIAIINSKGDVLSISQGPDIINQVPDASNMAIISCYTDIHCDKNYIYALYSGHPILDENMELIFPGIIHVFDWNGKPVAKLKLPLPVMVFTLDNKTNRFVSFSQLTGGIVYFSLPPELKKD